MAEAAAVPPHFLCPISLQVMRDPVTLSTGVTYDRLSISRWLSAVAANPTCPVTRLPLPDTHLTPNSTLHRLILSWFAANPTADELPIPEPAADVPRLLGRLRGPRPDRGALRELRDVVAAGEAGRSAAEDAGAAHVLVDLMKKSTVLQPEECLELLHQLRLSEEGLRGLAVRNADVVETLTRVLRVTTCCRSRAQAMSFARALFAAVSPERLKAVRGEFLAEVVRVVREGSSPEATKAALRVLLELMPWGRNRVRAAEAGAAEAVIEMLLKVPAGGRKVWEMAMVVMDMVCGCAEGRQAVVGHAAGIAVVSAALVGVSVIASDRAARVLCAVAKHTGRPAVLREMAEVGAVTRLRMAVQVEVDGRGRTREKVAEVLRLHGKAWERSPCVKSSLLTPWL